MTGTELLTGTFHWLLVARVGLAVLQYWSLPTPYRKLLASFPTPYRQYTTGLPPQTLKGTTGLLPNTIHANFGLPPNTIQDANSQWIYPGLLTVGQSPVLSRHSPMNAMC